MQVSRPLRFRYCLTLALAFVFSASSAAKKDPRRYQVQVAPTVKLSSPRKLRARIKALETMLDMSLDNNEVIKQLVQSVGSVQGLTTSLVSTSGTLTNQQSFLSPGKQGRVLEESFDAAGNLVSRKVTGEDSSDRVTQTGVIPAGPAINSPIPGLPGLGNSAIEWINSLVDLALYETISSYSLVSAGGSSKDFYYIANFEVNILPDRNHRNQACEIWFREPAYRDKQKGKPVAKYVKHFPERIAYNVYEFTQDASNIGLGVVVGPVSLGLNRNQIDSDYFLVKDVELISVGPVVLGDNTWFGWRIRPTLNRDYIVPGKRKLLAVLEFPDAVRTTVSQAGSTGPTSAHTGSSDTDPKTDRGDAQGFKFEVKSFTIPEEIKKLQQLQKQQELTPPTIDYSQPTETSSSSSDSASGATSSPSEVLPIEYHFRWVDLDCEKQLFDEDPGFQYRGITNLEFTTEGQPTIHGKSGNQFKISDTEVEARFVGENLGEAATVYLNSKVYPATVLTQSENGKLVDKVFFRCPAKELNPKDGYLSVVTDLGSVGQVLSEIFEVKAEKEKPKIGSIKVAVVSSALEAITLKLTADQDFPTGTRVHIWGGTIEGEALRNPGENKKEVVFTALSPGPMPIRRPFTFQVELPDGRFLPLRVR